MYKSKYKKQIMIALLFVNIILFVLAFYEDGLKVVSIGNIEKVKQL